MGQTVSVDVPHKLGAEEAERRVRAGIEALKSKYGETLSIVQVDWGEARADLTIAIFGHSLKAAMDFLPDCVRVSLELPWVLAMVAEKAKSLMAHQTEEMLRLPPPKG